MHPPDFSTFPYLSTASLTLRPLLEADLPEVFELRSDENILKYLGRPPDLTSDDTLAFIEKINKAIAENKSIYWAVSKKETSELIGTICLWNFNEEYTAAEIGYEMRSAFQGRGLMKEILQTVTDYAFGELKLLSIEAYLHTDNHKSLKLLEKNGFRFLAKAKESSMVVYTLKKTP